MFYLIPLLFIFVAVIVKLVAKRYGLKIFNVVCNIVITVCVIAFLYFFAAYNGFDIIEIVYNFLFNTEILKKIPLLF